MKQANYLIISFPSCFIIFLSFSIDIVLEKLASSKDKLKPDGTNISSWFSSLSTFCASLYAKHFSIELSGLTQVEKLEAEEEGKKEGKRGRREEEGRDVY